MHFEVLVEDQSGKKALDILIPKIIGEDNTFKTYCYKGIGRIPKGLKPKSDATKRILLDQLPKLLSGYGKTFAGYSSAFPSAVIVVFDLDQACLNTFRKELFAVLAKCNPKPETRFCIAIEEGEAWYLGDIPAIKTAYPQANESILKSYINDSICGTWELLADAIYPGGHLVLSKQPWQAIGKEKSQWALNISPCVSHSKMLTWLITLLFLILEEINIV